MNFESTSLPGAYLITLDRLADLRGFFARTFCQNEFGMHGLPTNVVQSNISFNKRKGTLRGMHFQRGEAAEAKLVCCAAGAIYDVIVDLRPDSPSYLKWYGRTLTMSNKEMLFIPKGLAHGFQSLCDDSEVSYQMFDFYAPESASGVRWNDPAFGIEWPEESQRIISEKDMSYPDYRP